ncbi:MAG: molybdenum cofactor biosynthesis protein MoaE [Nevskiaceae bacterium]|nr:MAG: molybdenum cofactor biosynthesis protein MoaE [Nevskiaceae bacterium]
MNRLTEKSLDLETLLTQTEDPACGALVVFGGTVRLDDGVQAIDYTAYAPLAEKALAEIEQETLQRFDIRHCRLVHRTGLLRLGELSVLVVVRGGHRGPSFEAARWAIDTLKARVPVWKEEHYRGGRSTFVEGQPIQQGDQNP